MKKILKIFKVLIILAILIIAYIALNNIPSILSFKVGETSISKVAETINAAQVIMDENEFYCHWHGHPPGHTSYEDVTSKQRIRNKNLAQVTAWTKGTPPNLSPKCDEKNFYQETTSRRISHGQSKTWSALDGETGISTSHKISLLNEKGKFIAQKGRGYAIEYMLTKPIKDPDEDYIYGWNEKDRYFSEGRLQGSLKQQAVWKTDGLTKNWESDLETEKKLKKAKQLMEEAYGYAAYYAKYKSNNYKVGKSLESTNARVCFNYDTNETIIGPFKVKYLSELDYDDITFCGITNMTLKGIDPNTYQEKTIKIDKFIEYDSMTYEPRYFTPKQADYYEDSSLIDKGEQYYPDSGENFFVVVNSTDVEHFTGLDVQFGALEAKSTIYFFRGFTFDVSITTATRKRNVGTKKKPTYEYQRYVKSCTVKTKLDVNSQYLFKTEGTRETRYDSLSCTIPQHEYNLQGNVWLDNASVDGIKQGNEPWKKGVEVFLLDENNNMVTKNSIGQALANPVVTGDNGYYEFKNLSFKKIYKLKYIYDGQLYEATTYTGLNYDANTLHSNATEKRSERTGLNSIFFDSTPQGIYKPSNYRYGLAEESYRTWLLEKSSSESPYGIKELYNSFINEAYNTQNFDVAFANLVAYNASDPNIYSKLQYISDCLITAYLGNNTDGDSTSTFPAFRQIVLDSKNKTIIGTVYHAVLGTQNIAFGITPREKMDVALAKDVSTVVTEINGKTHTYSYGRNAGVFDWDISGRISKGYYNQKYTREIFLADYAYKVSLYGNNTGGRTADNDELKIFVTYRISVKNQSSQLTADVTEVVDYYDSDFTYVDGRSYIAFNNGRGVVSATTGSIYGTRGEKNIGGYNSLYIRGLNSRKLSPGEQADIYLTFEVNKKVSNGQKWLVIDEDLYSRAAIGVGKENIAEINGVKSFYYNNYVPNMGVKQSNDIAGIMDIDSIPGNLLNTTSISKDGNIDYSKFEDDSDKSPNISIRIKENPPSSQDQIRRLDGFVWEDNRTKAANGAMVGNGIKDNGETVINGVKVELIEIRNNTATVLTTFRSGQNNVNGSNVYYPTQNIAVNSSGAIAYIVNNQNVPSGYKLLVPSVTDTAAGKYVFTNYPAGNYVIRFTYGDDKMTVVPNSGTIANTVGKGQNGKSYNGQDYKSTTYQSGITQVNTNDVYNNNEIFGFTYNIDNANKNANVSDAKDSWNRREVVNNYSKSNVTNAKAETLVSHEKVPTVSSELASKVNELINNTWMTAETGVIEVVVEYNKNTTIPNVNLGLEERPKSQLLINKEVSNVRVILSDGNTLFDANSKAMNVLWNKHQPHSVGYSSNKLNSVSINNQKAADAHYGLVQLSIDSELMLGARIMISYKITVRNVGEVDYYEKQFYYTGTVGNTTTVVKTKANQLIDYVGNNLQFAKTNNAAWDVIDKNSIKGTLINKGPSDTYSKEIDEYNVVITSSSSNKITTNELVPEIYSKTYGGTSSVTEDLLLTQLVSPDSDTDDLTYTNTVEIVMTSNTVGRRQAYSIVGNQNPKDTAPIMEIDTDRSQTVQLLPPFGNAGKNYVAAAIIGIAGIIVIIGIILIQKKVLKVEMPDVGEENRKRQPRIKQVKRQPKR